MKMTNLKIFSIKIILLLANTLVKRKLSNVFSDPQRKINLGCGLHCLKGWLNIDGSLTSLLGTKFRFFNRILYKIAGSSAYYSFEDFDDVIRNKKLFWCDLTKKLPLDNGTVDVVFTSHFLEHLSKKQGERFLTDVYRVMKIGGLVRILVPDLDLAIKRLSEGKINETLDLFFYTSEEFDYSAHKYNYTFESLKEKLENIGFKEVVRENHQKGECPDIEFLDVYPDHSLYAEARK